MDKQLSTDDMHKTLDLASDMIAKGEQGKALALLLAVVRSLVPYGTDDRVS